MSGSSARRPKLTQSRVAIWAVLLAVGGWTLLRWVQNRGTERIVLDSSAMPDSSASPAGAATAPPPSSLSLVVPPVSGDGQSPTPAMEGPFAPGPVPKSPVELVDSVMPMLSDPKLTTSMPPKQARQVKELVGVITELRDGLRRGGMSPDKQAQANRKLQQLVVELMQTASGPPAQAQAKEKKKP